jgi:hypothetical protein
MKFTIHSPKYGDHIVLIDDEDWEKIKNHSWHVSYQNHRLKYVAVHKRINGKKKHISLHTYLTSYYFCDHKDGNVLNNQKSNLRQATCLQNQRNKSISNINTSGYKGVTWHKNAKKWQSSIRINYTLKYLGCFNTKEEAAFIYNQAAIKYFGEFARLNNILERG